MRTWLVTGVTRGLGLSIARAAIEAGDRVIGTVRTSAPSSIADHQNVHILKADMADPEAIEAVVHEAFELAEKIDVIVNNAGFGLLGAVEESTDEELVTLFAVDFFAPVRIVRAALPYLRQQGSGHIVNMSSVAGRAPSLGASLYSAAKHAIEGFSASLALEVAPFGIKVTAVAPGQFRTDFLETGRIRLSRNEDSTYSESVGQAMSTLAAVHHHQLGDPELAAQAILNLTRAENPPLHLLLGSDALARVRHKLDAVLREMEAWEQYTLSTDFKQVPDANTHQVDSGTITRRSLTSDE
ncbi:SDR family NAD(P)-dependent oxidoreductase [Mesorhizobium sp. M0965]|uniref:SDR family NAD(P)-dependent oxidoreductase n=1 Tax=Mesorhizobium sp. M0965 TaxID=2957036 RepID=UPI00333BFE41